MPDKTYKIIEVVGVSDDSIHQAVSNAVNKARQTLRNMRGTMREREGYLYS
jgi:flavin-binding protein dodecin